MPQFPALFKSQMYKLMLYQTLHDNAQMSHLHTTHVNLQQWFRGLKVQNHLFNRLV